MSNLHDMKTINWTAEMLERLKKAYAHAVETNLESFEFDGNEFNTNYAKYLIEYLDNTLFGV